MPSPRWHQWPTDRHGLIPRYRSRRTLKATPNCGDLPLMAPAVILIVLVVSAVGAVLELRWGDRKIAGERAEAAARRSAEAKRRSTDQAPFPTHHG